MKLIFITKYNNHQDVFNKWMINLDNESNSLRQTDYSLSCLLPMTFGAVTSPGTNRSWYAPQMFRYRSVQDKDHSKRRNVIVRLRLRIKGSWLKSWSVHCFFFIFCRTSHLPYHKLFPCLCMWCFQGKYITMHFFRHVRRWSWWF